jgi:hypothetical protein
MTSSHFFSSPSGVRIPDGSSPFPLVTWPLATSALEPAVMTCVSRNTQNNLSIEMSGVCLIIAARQDATHGQGVINSGYSEQRSSAGRCLIGAPPPQFGPLKTTRSLN